MAVKRKIDPIEVDNKIIGARVSRDNLENDFDGYYDTMCKLLNADSIKIRNYDDDKVIMYDRDMNIKQKVNYV